MAGYNTADQNAPYRSWKAVTPSDSVNLAAGVRGLYIAGAGNVVCVGDDNATMTIAVVAGQFVNVGPKRVNATSTTATGIIALY